MTDAAARTDPQQPFTDGTVRVRGARLHNLRGVDVDFPRGQLVSFTGISGSGKSSLAFGTVHGESQRRYLESVAPFARRLIGSAVDPRVEAVSGMPPTVALEQRTSGGGPRSTVGTVTNLSNAIRLLYSRAGEHPADVLAKGSALASNHLTSDTFSPNTPEGMCPTCHGAGVLREPTEESMVPDPSLSIRDGAIEAWPGGWLGKNFREILDTLDIDTRVPWRDLPEETRRWILFTEEQPVVTVTPVRGADKTHGTYQGTWRSVRRYLLHTANSKAQTSRRRALGYMSQRSCPTCDGHRLNPDALRVTYLGRRITELNALPAAELHEVVLARSRELEQAGAHTPEQEAEHLLLPTVLPVLDTVVGLGLGHLAMDRPATTLSTGELQRLRLAAQLRSGLFGVAYVLDEPSAGLHPSEKGVLTTLFHRFLAEGNSVLLVEHDMSLVEQSDWLVDVGPGAGVAGGEVLYSGPPAGLSGVAGSRTAEYLGSPLPVPTGTPRTPGGRLELRGITARTLRELDATFPLGVFTAVAGVSGAGKSTLVTHVLGDILADRLVATDDDEAAGTDDVPDWAAEQPATVREVTGREQVDRLVSITQKPIGRTPRSCLATYTGLLDRVRRLFAGTAEARERGWGVGRFSFNVAEGRCPECSGMGQIEVELVFLPGSYAVCPVCHGTRYAAETLEVTYHGRNIAEVLALSVRDARGFFAEDDRISRALTALDAVGLGYLTLGQRATELSGGEAQRIKLATELQRPARGHTVYLLDEPTTGLHPADGDLLVTELNRLVERGDTVIVVEHDPRVLARADHVIELGPGAGDRGGRVIATGTPAELSRDPASVTGPYLRA